MRVFSLILVCFVTALILQPAVTALANEEDTCCEGSCEKTEQEAEIPGGFCTEKNCNPFAYCCYSIGYTVAASIDYNIPASATSAPVLSFRTTISSSYFAKFWQPPQHS